MTQEALIEKKMISGNHNGSSWPDKAIDASIKYESSFKNGVRQFSNVETAKERAAFTRWKTIENLDKYLIEFEANFIRSGGKVIWAQDITDALMEILTILNRSANKTVVKSKSQTSAEIGLDRRLTQEGFNSLETDTGDFILKQFAEEGSHMVLPAIHKSLSEIGQLFHDQFGLNKDADAEQLVDYIRKSLRNEFLTAGAGITGANFIIADPGSIVIMENEGNAQLTASLPKIHIVIAGIEKILPSLSDLDLFLPLLSTFGTGQELTAYNSIITGPKQAEESDGPEELYVILLDNGRSNVLAHEIQRQAMSCIKCGACEYASPVYRAAGHAEYPNPIAAVTIPLQHDMESNQHLTQSSSLCAACSNVCPVKIDIPKLLLENKKLFVDLGLSSRSEKWFYFIWKKAMLKRDIMNWKGIRAGKYIMETLYKSKYNSRTMPSVASKSFNEMWRDKMNYK